MKNLLLIKIRRMVLFFVVALAISGITAFPVYTELKWIMESGWLPTNGFLYHWLGKVYVGVADSQTKYPFLFYGVYKTPVKNKFIIDWAMFCCICIIPLAFICGPIRGIPLGHILIDCSFGVFGIMPLLLCRKWINQLEKLG